jgi:hypothetical protein
VDLVDPDETQVATADSDVKPRKIAKGLFCCISLVTKKQMRNPKFLCYDFLLLLLVHWLHYNQGHFVFRIWFLVVG